MPKRALHIELHALEPVTVVKRAKHCAAVEALAPRLARAALALAEAAGAALSAVAAAVMTTVRAGWRDAAARREAAAAAATEAAWRAAVEAQAVRREAIEAAAWRRIHADEAAAAGLFSDEGDHLSHHSLSSGDLDCCGGCYDESCGADDCCFQEGGAPAAPFTQCLGRTVAGARCRVNSHHDFFNAEPLWAGAAYCRLHAYQQPIGGGHGAGSSTGVSCSEGEEDCPCCA